MRLGQLARQFDITPQEIVSYLKTKGVDANPHPNSKLNEEEERLVMEHFDILPVVEEVDEIIEETPALSAEPVVDTKAINQEEEIVWDAEDSTIEAEPASPIQEETTLSPTEGLDEKEEEEKEEEKKIEDIPVATVDEILADESETLAKKVALIKAPKVELQGLKVLGKIELPQPKTKEQSTEEEEVKGAKKEKPEKTGKGKFANRKPLSPEQREKKRQELREKNRKKQEWEAHKQKLRESRQKKAAREEFYKKQVLANVAVDSDVKPVKKKTKKKQSAPKAPKKPAPKTVLGKFWRWLNT